MVRHYTEEAALTRIEALLEQIQNGQKRFVGDISMGAWRKALLTNQGVYLQTTPFLYAEYLPDPFFAVLY